MSVTRNLIFSKIIVGFLEWFTNSKQNTYLNELNVMITLTHEKKEIYYRVSSTESIFQCVFLHFRPMPSKKILVTS